MVSKFQHHLSLFLVVTVATSWFFVPSGQTVVLAQGSTSGATTTAIAARSVFNDSIPSGNKINFFDSGNLGFKEDKAKKLLIHTFKADARTFQQNYKHTGKVWAGCTNLLSKTTDAACTEKTPENYDLFADQPLDIQTPGSGSFLPVHTKTFKQADLYTYDDVTGRAQIIKLDNIIYGFFFFKDIPASGTRKAYRNYSKGIYQEKQVIDHYMNWINCAQSSAGGGLGGGISNSYHSGTCPKIRRINDGKTTVALTEEEKKAANFEIEQLFKRWFDPTKFKGRFIIKDSSADAAPTTPPVVIAEPVPSGDSLGTKLTFTLKHVLTSSGGHWKNNFFAFQLTSAANESLLGSIDKSRVFLAIDISGNIGFILNDPEKNVASDAEHFIDDNIIMIGNISQNQWFSQNEFKAPFGVKTVHGIRLEDYKKVITTRAYNEYNRAEPSKCGEVVKFPQVNQFWEGNVTNGIPQGDDRRCINVGTGGWLEKWGVTVNKLDDQSSSTDPCIRSLEGKDAITYTIGSAMCGILKWIIDTATFFALFSMDFLLATVDLQ